MLNSLTAEAGLNLEFKSNHATNEFVIEVATIEFRLNNYTFSLDVVWNVKPLPKRTEWSGI